MNRIFPPQDGSEGIISAQFEVAGLTLVTLSGMRDGDCVEVQTRLVDGCDTNEWVPYNDLDCCFCVSYPQNQFFLSIPGQYRLVFSNSLDSHLSDPTWFEDTSAFYEPVAYVQSLLSNFKGDCDMGCCSSSNSIAAVMPSATSPGWNIVMSDGTVLPIDIVAGTGIDITGNVISATGASGTGTDVSIVDNGDGTYTVDNGTDPAFTIDTTDVDVVTTVTDNGDGTFTISDGTNSVNVTDTTSCDCITFTENADGSFTVDNGTVSGTFSSDTNTFGTVTTATATGTDSCGRDYEIGDCLITFPDNTSFSYPAPDTTDPILTNPTGIINASDEIEGSVETDDGTGNIYAVLTTSATQPSEQQIIGGEDETGSPALGQDVIMNPGVGVAGPFDFGPPSGSADCYIHYVEVDPSGNISNVVSSTAVAKPQTPMDIFTDPNCWIGDGFALDTDANNDIVTWRQEVGAAGFDNVRMNPAATNCFIPIADNSNDINFGWTIPTIPDTLTDRFRITIRFFGSQSPASATNSQIGTDVRLISSTFVPTAGQIYSNISVTPPAGANFWYPQFSAIDAHNGNPDVFTLENFTFDNTL